MNFSPAGHKRFVHSLSQTRLGMLPSVSMSCGLIQTSGFTAQALSPTKDKYTYI